MKIQAEIRKTIIDRLKKIITEVDSVNISSFNFKLTPSTFITEYNGATIDYDPLKSTCSASIETKHGSITIEFTE